MTVSSASAQDQFEIITSHPRIVLTKEAELSLQFLFLENEDASDIRKSLRLNADKFLDEKTPGANDVKELIQKGQLDNLFYKVSTLAMAYRLFEDDKYADKVSGYLVAICQLPNWQTDNLEITAGLTALCGLGYDWLYYYLNRENRELVRNSIIQKGLNPGLNEISNLADSAKYFGKNANKMLLVSSGLVLGSLSVADDFPEVNKKVVYRFLVNNKSTLEDLNFLKIRELYGDEWNKNISYLYMVLASLNASFGHDFKITSLDNIKSLSNDYLSYLEGQINASHDVKGYFLNPALLWFGKLNGNTETNEFYLQSVKKYHFGTGQKSQLDYTCLLWMI